VNAWRSLKPLRQAAVRWSWDFASSLTVGGDEQGVCHRRLPACQRPIAAFPAPSAGIPLGMEAATHRLAGTVEALNEARKRLAPRAGRDRAREVIRAFEEHDLLVAATALAFRVLLAAIPVLLFLVGLLGLLHLGSLWTDHVAQDLRSSVSQPAFKLINRAVGYVLHSQQLFWVTAGAAIATWEMSGVVRGVANVLNRLYGVEDDRPRLERLANSLWVAAAVAALFICALAAARLLPSAVQGVVGSGPAADAVGAIVGVLLAALLLLVAISLMVRVGPDQERPLGWVTFGAVLVVSGWILMSALFALYLSEIASYATVFGTMATAFIALEYLFLLAAVFLGGLTIDALAEGRAKR
jgi:membrane protein